ncbi:DUF2938 domain-containing protein [Maricaulis sp. D1M11]|uniref:DUF2938 domain-containing protein n=1 Tax=Maricaulis sp. D1M11 TaxID=3076117 RepID=UPI0039B4CE85
MTEFQVFWLAALGLGIGATLVMDLWAVIKRHVWHSPSLDYALVGRWFGHMPRGRFVHRTIMQAPYVPYERPGGWVLHYLSGIAFAALLLSLVGLDWLNQPTLWPALGVGLATVIVPIFVMQPAFGFGMAASQTPNPGQARFHSLLTHAVFGLGLYLSAVILAPVWPVHGG